MFESNQNQNTVVRTERGLSVAGTRTTLYQIMDYVKAGRSPAMIRDHFHLTVKQTFDILKYIKNHSKEVEAEYQQVLDYAENIRQYWEKQNQKCLNKIKLNSQNPCKKQLYDKLQAAKSRLGMI